MRIHLRSCHPLKSRRRGRDVEGSFFEGGWQSLVAYGQP